MLRLLLLVLGVALLCRAEPHKRSLEHGSIVGWDYGLRTRGGIAVVTVAVFDNGDERPRSAMAKQTPDKRSGWSDVALLGFAEKLVYSLSNGYAFFVLRNASAAPQALEAHWSKITAIRAVMRLAHVDYVLFLDVDAQPRDPDVSIESLVARMGNATAMLTTWLDKGTDSSCLSVDWTRYATWTCRTTPCPCEVNTGVILFRKSHTALDMLDVWQSAYNAAQPKDNHRWDQFGFNNKVMAAYWPHVKLLDRSVMNYIGSDSVVYHPAAMKPDAKRSLLAQQFWSFITDMLRN